MDIIAAYVLSAIGVVLVGLVISSTIRSLARDGYRPAPVDRERLRRLRESREREDWDLALRLAPRQRTSPGAVFRAGAVDS